MNVNYYKFSVPVLDENTEEVYEKLYGVDGKKYVDILSISPNEIAVISRMLAYLREKNERT